VKESADIRWLRCGFFAYSFGSKEYGMLGRMKEGGAMSRQVARGAVLDLLQVATYYLTAKERVIGAGFADEIDWQEEVSLDAMDESTFLREAAWVVLSAGFKESILRRCFGTVSRAFLEWESGQSIMAQREQCRTHALEAFGNERKIDAIVSISERVARIGICEVRRQISDYGTEFLRELPFIGPITACHLAKNLGMPIVKPDRHLVRVAARMGFDSPQEMCHVISDLVGDPVSVIDIVIWRDSTLGTRVGL
jgi:hypothetical protein